MATSSLENIAATHGFTLESTEDLPEIEGRAHVMRHEASGAKLLYLENDDHDKAFSVGFKTPAADDTGVFHILEHSVLCGSERYPVKEPFVNLLKSSMQTFLNAMTFPDKTMYPVASTNEQDLFNLMDVYMDAVFHPAIYDKPNIFRQEGWHLELADSSDGAETPSESAEGEETGSHNRRLAINGVVFNEMKGALSEPDSVLYNALSAALFPDTTYAFESGGTPASIPDLTYESFLDSHRRHYRTDNCYLTLYGDIDIDKALAFLDRRHLTPLAEERAKSAVETGDPNPLELQKPVVNMEARVEMATTPENSAMALGYVVGTSHERERVLAAGILLDALMSSNEAPLKRALLDAKLADDAQAFLSDGIAQPFIMLELKGLREGATARFEETVRRCVERLVETGIDRTFLEATISRNEFVMREGNFGYSDGVIYAMTALSGWLYDDSDATAYLHYENDFRDLRAKLNTTYFEDLAREVFLENAHRAAAELVVTDTDAPDATAERLSSLEASFTSADYDAVEAAVRSLRDDQEAPDSPEDLAKLPTLSLNDVGQAPEEAHCRVLDGFPLPVLKHDIRTSGIDFVYQYFDISELSDADLPYAGVLAMVLGKLGTEHLSAAELATLVRSKLGNLGFNVEVHEDAMDADVFTPLFVVGTSALSQNAPWCARIVNEVCTSSDFDDTDKIKDILTQKRVAIEQDIVNAGNSYAMGRVSSYTLPAAALRERLSGIDFYLFLKDLLSRFDEVSEELPARLRDVARRIFTDSPSLVSFAGAEADLADYFSPAPLADAAELPEDADSAPRSAIAGEAGVSHLGKNAPIGEKKISTELFAGNEAFIVPSDVTYTAMGYDRRLLNVPYSGAWLLATRALSYDYLWNEVRVKGGAYGAGFKITRPGAMRFYSYRDPRIDETVARFKGAGAWLSAYSPSEQEYDGFKISTVAGLDNPLKARTLLRRQDGDHFSNTPDGYRDRLRREVIDADLEDVRALGSAVTDMAARNLICTVGNARIVAASRTPLESVDLFGRQSDE